MPTQQIGLIDYGMGNLHSAGKALERVSDGAKVIISSDPKEIMRCDRVVLPGVGSIRDCMGEIRRLGFDQMVAELLGKKPLLAICIGIQALMDFSDENGGTACLGVLPGQVRKFDSGRLTSQGTKLKVPHMGWNRVTQIKDHPLWKNISDGSRFYFVHSYYVSAANQEQVSGTTDYGVSFASAMAGDKLFAVQFHPEKSQTAGLQLLKNFINWDGEV